MLVFKSIIAASALALCTSVAFGDTNKTETKMIQLCNEQKVCKEVPLTLKLLKQCKGGNCELKGLDGSEPLKLCGKKSGFCVLLPPKMQRLLTPLKELCQGDKGKERALCKLKDKKMMDKS